MIRMILKGLILDPVNKTPVIILKEKDKDRFLPIWIGFFEANAIATQLENIVPPRPMTHDLLRSVIKRMEAQVDYVLINDLKDNTFYAQLHVNTKHLGPVVIDSRPSDAIALAVRVNAPIFCAPHVLEEAHSIDISKEEDMDEKLKEWLEGMDPNDFGKFKM